MSKYYVTEERYCPDCWGSGVIQQPAPHTCEKCNGSGVVRSECDLVDALDELDVLRKRDLRD